jgi:hypothetical protein
VEDLQHALEDVDIVLDGFATGDDLNVPRPLDSVWVASAECSQALLQLRLGFGDMLVQPKLDASPPAFGRFQDAREDALIVAENVACKVKPMRKGWSERHFRSGRIDLKTHRREYPGSAGR